MDNDNCSICFENSINNNDMVCPSHCQCNIVLHQICLDECIKKMDMLCPMCRLTNKKPPIPHHLINQDDIIIKILNLPTWGIINLLLVMIYSMLAVTFYIVPMTILHCISFTYDYLALMILEYIDIIFNIHNFNEKYVML